MNMEQCDPRRTIFPTFQCFNDSMEFIDHIAGECPELMDTMVLVHGICLSDGGREFVHAWVEDIKNKMAIFCGIYMGERVYLAAPLENFFAGYTVKEATRYTVMEAMQNNLRTVHFGPWEKKYDALCFDGQSERVLGGGQMEKVVILGSLPKPNKTRGG